jgi:hypothetical protein
MSKDLSIRIRAEFEAASGQLSVALKKIQAEADELKDDLQDAGAASARALDTIGLGADRQVPRLQRINSAVQGFTGKLGQGLGAINNIAKGMAPWNQALNLAGKAINFAKDGLDAYAKTSADAAYEVNKLKKEFEGYEQSVMAGVGFLTVELLKPAMSFDEMRRSMIRVENTELYKRLFKGGVNMFEGSNEAGDPLESLSSSINAIKQTFGAVTENINRYGEVDTVLGNINDKLREQTAEARKAAVETKRWVAEWNEFGKAEAARRNVADVRTPDFTSQKNISTDMLGQGDALDKLLEADIRARNLATGSDRFAASAGRRNESYLETLFGPIDEFSAYGTAFGALTTATQTAMAAWISGSMSLGTAVKKGIGEALAGVASQMAIESLKHGAFALGSLAFFDFGGAAKHGAAAAGFGAGAVAAAAAARKLGGSVNADIAAQRDSASAAKDEERAARSSGGGSSGGSSSGGTERIIERVVVLGEHFYTESARMKQLDSKRFTEAAFGTSYVEHD